MKILTREQFEDNVLGTRTFWIFLALLVFLWAIWPQSHEESSRGPVSPSSSVVEGSNSPSQPVPTTGHDSRNTSSAAVPNAKPASKAVLGRRFYADVLRVELQDRRVNISLSGENEDVLEISSGLYWHDGENRLFSGDSNTAVAVDASTIACTQCMRDMRKAGFKALIIRGATNSQYDPKDWH
jgi:hypothetical protein